MGNGGRKKDKAAAGGADQQVDLSHHPVIEKLMRLHGGSLPDAVELVGYLGPSDKDDSVRLYLDLSFKSYVEIPKEGAVLYREPHDPSAEAKPTTILVSASAKLKLVRVEVLEQAVEASFLRGNIASTCPIQVPICRPQACCGTWIRCACEPLTGSHRIY